MSVRVAYPARGEMPIPCADAAAQFQRFAATGVQFREVCFQNGDSGL